LGKCKIIFFHGHYYLLTHIPADSSVIHGAYLCSQWNVKSMTLLLDSQTFCDKFKAMLLLLLLVGSQYHYSAHFYSVYSLLVLELQKFRQIKHRSFKGICIFTISMFEQISFYLQSHITISSYMALTPTLLDDQFYLEFQEILL
jgi:hypothetical protein